MSEKKSINTRISLRNDDIAAWEANSTTVPLKGEVTLAKRADGSYDLRIGDGAKNWGELSNSLMISADQIYGLTTKLNEVTTSNYVGITTINPQIASQDEVKAEANRISGKTEYIKGDTLILKELIVAADETKGTEAKYQHAAYVWNGTDWAAMDGTYNADSVYFDEDLIFTVETFGALKANYGWNSTTKSGTITSTGKTLEEVIKGMIAKESQPTVSNPSISFTAQTAKEIGSTVASPSVTATFSAGSYTYGPATGSTVTSPGWTLKMNGTEITATTVKGTTGTSVTYTSTNENFVVTEGNCYALSAGAPYTDGANAVTNMGTVTDKKVSASTATKTANLYYGYYPEYYGYAAEPTFSESDIDADLITGLTKATAPAVGTVAATPANKIPKGTIQFHEWFYAVPKSKITNNKVIAAKNGDGLPYTVNTAEITLHGTTYIVSYAYTPKIGDPTEITLTWGK